MTDIVSQGKHGARSRSKMGERNTLQALYLRLGADRQADG